MKLSEIELAFEFLSISPQGESQVVWGYFGKRGAYSRFKELLAGKGVLESWYEFESDAQRRALVAWCNESDVPVDSETT